MSKTLLPLCAALLLFPATGFAAPTPSEGYVNDEGALVTQEGNVQLVNFGEDEEIDGEVLKAMGDDLNGRSPVAHKSMIHMRTNFLAQLSKLSADI